MAMAQKIIKRLEGKLMKFCLIRNLSGEICEKIIWNICGRNF